MGDPELIGRPVAFGWTADRERELGEFELPEGAPARVARIERRKILALGAEAAGGSSDDWTPVLGTLRFHGDGDLRKLAVGDWVWLRGGAHPAAESVLPRTSFLARRRATRRTEGQPIAANVDAVFVVTTPTLDLNLARLERYVAAIRDAGSTPYIVVNKVDEAHDPVGVDAVLANLAGVAALRVSARTREGLDALEHVLPAGQTAAFVGSSGVGKSSLVNRFLGRETQTTTAVRAADEKGRHTTTTRQLFVAPSGALVVDNPGVREFGLWDADEGVQETFADVEALVAACRFSDCGHDSEPGCAVQAALASGALSEDRWRRFDKLRRELDHNRERRAEGERTDAKKRWKKIHAEGRTLRKFHRKQGLKG